jgi:predicted HAD superfamily Cof-like phosphohydrolase
MEIYHGSTVKRILIVDIDTDRVDTIRIGPMQRFENEKIEPNPVSDMSVLCEAVCTMIHLCHQEGIKDESQSLRDCIKHLQDGFVAPGYKAHLVTHGIKEQEMVKEFHKAFDILINDNPTMPDQLTRELRIALIEEECFELDEAFVEENIVKVADAIGDLLYVVYGAAVSCGINMDAIFKEIHRSNMTKVGGRKRADGKWEKPDTYSPANLKPIIDQQLTRSNHASDDCQRNALDAGSPELPQNPAQ